MILGACGSSDELVQQIPVEERFAEAMQLFEDEDYLDAEKEFRVITLQFPGTILADDAQFHLGECRYLYGDYILAAYEYDVLLRTMPTSEFASRARFRKADCYYNLSPESYRDQDYTRKAIDEFQAFLEYYPTDSLAGLAANRIHEMNTKLARKEYENGETYIKTNSYKAALYYFELVLEKYHDTPYAELAQLKKAEVNFLRKRYSDAKTDIDLFFQRYPESDSKATAEKLRNDITAQLSGGGEGAQGKSQAAPNSVKQF
ncbi:MAG: outer membrane protein assembly factor BamD [Ignavibacteriae bacterium]|nr:outer membrane protein assembly factor BamD [Ignavibacteriota bacterium]